MKLIHSPREYVKGWQCRCGSSCACCCICNDPDYGNNGPDWQSQFREHMAWLQEAAEDILEINSQAEAETGMPFVVIRRHLIEHAR